MLLSFNFAKMSAPVEEMIFTLKQGSEESFKESWSRINSSYSKTEPRMTSGLLLSSFILILFCVIDMLYDTVAGGDFLLCDGDQAFNTIKSSLQHIAHLVILIHSL
jgi:hypothetical protein